MSLRVNFLTFTIVMVAAFTTVGRADPPKFLGARPAVPLVITVDDSFNAQQKKIFLDTLKNSLEFLALVPPKDTPRHFFQWDQDQELLHGKTVHIHYLRSDSPMVRSLVSHLEVLTPDVGSMTVASLGNTDPNELEIFVFVFADKLSMNNSGQMRSDSGARTLHMLIHELFGSVQSFLELDAVSSEDSREMRILRQLRSFATSMRYLNHFFESDAFDSLPGNIQNQMKELAILRKRQFLKWERALGARSGCVHYLGEEKWRKN